MPTLPHDIAVAPVGSEPGPGPLGVPGVSDASPQAEGRSRPPRIAITLGDPNGVGPEIALKSVRELSGLGIAQPVLVGSPRALRAHAERMGSPPLNLRPATSLPDQIPPGAWLVLHGPEDDAFEPTFGKVVPEAGALAMRAVERAVILCLAGDVDAMVTAPVHKEAIAQAGYAHPGHTEFIARLAGCERHAMTMVADGLRVGLVTAHRPLRDVAAAITQDAVRTAIQVIHAALCGDFGVARPNIAVLGLNPHAGEGGVLGHEETRAISPAIREAQAGGILASGPYPADGFFGSGAWRRCDAVLAMYHDQGLAPFKTLAFGRGVNYTAGLPIVRTSPDHGTAFDIAGQGRARPESMLAAIRLAVDIAQRRSAL